jgi:hypothetical protein
MTNLLQYCRTTYGDRAAKMLPCYIRGNLSNSQRGKGNKSSRRLLGQTTMNGAKVVISPNWNWFNRPLSQREILTRKLQFVFNRPLGKQFDAAKIMW